MYDKFDKMYPPSENKCKEGPTERQEVSKNVFYGDTRKRQMALQLRTYCRRNNHWSKNQQRAERQPSYRSET